MKKQKSKPSKSGRVTPITPGDVTMNGKNGAVVYLDNGDTSKNGLPKAEVSNKDGDTDSKTSKEKEEEEVKMVSFFGVFRFATSLDVLFMLMGTLCAAIHGSAFPLMVIVFGELIDVFVDSGKVGLFIEDLDAYTPSIITSLGLVKADLYEDPTILNAYDANITSLSAGTILLSSISEALKNDLLDTMTRFALYFVAIGGGVIVIGYGQVMFWMMASERQTHRMRKQFYENVMRQNIGWFDVNQSNELNSRLTADISKIHDGIGDKVGSFFQNFCAFLAGMTIGFVYGWKLTLVTLSVSPLLAGAAFSMTKLVGMASSQELKAYAKAGAIAEEVLGGIRTVAAFGGQAKESKRYDANLTGARDLGVRKGFVNGLSLGVTWLLIFCAYALGFWYGAKLSRDEPSNYTIGNVMIVFFAVLVGAFSLGNALPGLQSYAVARGAAYTIHEIIDLEPPIDSASKEGKTIANIQGNITLKNLHFKYPSRPDVPILNGVNLSVDKGKTVALVGSSGCGKSTVVALVQRFYDPEKGQVFIDDVDLTELNIKWLRQHIGIVSQEPVLFATTIAENIRYGLEGVSQDDIEAAARQANAHDFILNLPDKYETLVGERGAQLSGGQKQRVAIARALVRDPKILLLDEATSALDTESEGVVQDALEKASHGRTTIVIAHRLSTIKNADKIAGFKDGVIVEHGTHGELMSKSGIYHSLVTLQTSKTEDDIEAEMYEKPKAKAAVSKAIIADPKSPAKEDVSDEKDSEDEEKKEEVDAGLGRILRLNASEWYLILGGLFASIINGGMMPAFAIIFAEILGVFSEADKDKQTKDIALYCLIFTGLGVLSFFSQFFQAYFFSKSGEYLTLRLRSLSFKALMRQEMAYFDDHNNSIGALTTRLATDASQVQGAAGIRLGMALMSVCSLLAGVIIAFIYSWKMTLLVLAFFPFMVIAGALEMQMLTGAAGKNKEALEASGKVAIESIENIRTVASLTIENAFRKKFEDALEGPYRSALLKAHVVGISFSLSQSVIFFAYGTSFWFGAYLIEQGELDYIKVFKVFSAIMFGAMSIGQASAFAPDAAKAQTSTEEIFKLLDKEPTINSDSTDGETLTEGSFSSSIHFENVSFFYPTRPDVKVLNQLNLDITPGSTVALVGSSGCGKSTTVQMIERFYDAADGCVRLDKYDTKDLNIQFLRSQIGIVSQEPVLFDRTIADNIAYGDNSRDVPMAEIIAAARNSNIHDFIASLPEGYDTNVGEKGAQLSGGQKQRVAIARALVRNPKILLLDEATSALDTESEKVVQDALDRAREGRTSIVIAHRLSTIQNADKICVIRHGVVSEQGKHNELMQKQGFYYKLNQAQARKK